MARKCVGVLVSVASVGALLGFVGVAVEAAAPAGSPVAATAVSADPIEGGLGYTALTAPCRAVDTRNGGGVLAPGATREFRMRGEESFASQGGSVSGCGVPEGASAVEISVTAVSPSGANGFVRAFAAGSPPGATVLNYTVGRGITNTGTIPLSAPAINGQGGLSNLVTNDLGVSNAGGTIHLIVDVQGYFSAEGGASYVPLAAPCRVVDTRIGGGTIPPGGSRPFQVAGSEGNFAAQGGRANGCGVPDGVPGVEVSLSVISPVGAGVIRIAPNNGTNPNAAFANYTNATGITNTGSISLSEDEARDVMVRSLGGTAHVAIDVQGYYTTAPGVGTRYQTVTPCRTFDTRNAGGPLAAGQTRNFQTGGGRVEFPNQGAANVTGCGIPQRAAAVEASLTALAPSGAGFTRPGPSGAIATATFLNFTAAGGITNTGTIPLGLSGIADLSITNLGAGSGYALDVLGYYEPPSASARLTESISAGSHSCMIIGGGAVECWGSNSFGGIGDGTTTTPRSNPTSASGLSGAVQVVAGRGHTCALIDDGTVSCWGRNGSGQVGDGGTTNRLTPNTVAGLTDVVQIAGSGEHTCALLASRTVSCWGDNSDGQLGNNSTEQQNSPTAVPGLTGVVQIATGAFHTCATLANRTARCWGNNGNGQIGDGTFDNTRLTPTAVPGLTGVVQIVAGQFHSCALLANGTARCWGANDNGQLGDGTTVQRNSPTTVSGLTGAVQISAERSNHTCALLANGAGRCWGLNNNGQVGDGTTTQRLIPTAVSGLTGTVEISAGGSHTCAVSVLGEAYCWGQNNNGQVGDGTTDGPRTTPTPVAGVPVD